MNLYPAHPVLLVDDEEDILAVLKTALALAGITNTILCSGGSAALDLAQRREFEAVLLDVLMPGLKGEVLETKDVDSYTYLRLKTTQGEVWAATAKTPVKKGAQVSLVNTTVMENFESKSLKRKFDRIVFGTIADPNAKAAAGAPAGSPHGAPAVAAAPVAKVAKAAGPDAKTVAEVVGGKASLKNKTVAVRGQVVKVNLGIMGKNWVHLQDGSGSAKDGTHDILVTTADTAAVGDTVVARGVVHTDVNLGSGYAYAVLIEEATIRK